MRWSYFLSFARILLLLGLIVPMNGATAGGPDELRTRLDKVAALFAETHKLVGQEGEVLQELHTTTDLELEHQLRSQHQEVLQKITKISKSRLRTLGGAVDLLSGYGPDSLRDCEAAIYETERLVKFLKMERDGILSDPDAPEGLVTELGIDKLLERAVIQLRFLFTEKKKLLEKKSPSRADTKIEKQPEEPEPKEGFMAWFDKQEATVKAALIAAIVSIFGTLATVIVAAIRRRG